VRFDVAAEEQIFDEPRSDFFVWPGLYLRKSVAREWFEVGDYQWVMAPVNTITFGARWLRADPRVSLSILPWSRRGSPAGSGTSTL
jgi:hypothetical protein